MAFSNEQVQQIRLYLGYSLIFNDDLYFLTSALALVGSDSVKQGMVEGYLSKVQEAEDKVAEATQAAGIKKADEVEFFNASGQVAGYITEGKRAISRISLILNVPVAADYFGTQGMGTSSNVMRMG